MFTAEGIIYNKIENTKKDFDSKNKELLMEVESEIATAHVVKLIGLLGGADFITGNKVYFLSLLLKAEDIVITSFHLTRQRAYIEALSLLRIAIEAIATAIHISKEEKVLNNYLYGKDYKSTRSIGYSKKYIPIIGEIWGAFSEAGVHINSKMYGPEVEIDKNKLHESILINYKIRPSNDRLDNLMLIAVRLIAVMVHRAFEIIFFKEGIYEGQSCLSISGTNSIILGAKYSDKINDLYSKILDVESFNKQEK